jgi:hypothetical protein
MIKLIFQGQDSLDCAFHFGNVLPVRIAAWIGVRIPPSHNEIRLLRQFMTRMADYLIKRLSLHSETHDLLLKLLAVHCQSFRLEH